MKKIIITSLIFTALNTNNAYSLDYYYSNSKNINFQQTAETSGLVAMNIESCNTKSKFYFLDVNSYFEAKSMFCVPSPKKTYIMFIPYLDKDQLPLDINGYFYEPSFSLMIKNIIKKAGNSSKINIVYNKKMESYYDNAIRFLRNNIKNVNLIPYSDLRSYLEYVRGIRERQETYIYLPDFKNFERRMYDLFYQKHQRKLSIAIFDKGLNDTRSPPLFSNTYSAGERLHMSIIKPFKGLQTFQSSRVNTNIRLLDKLKYRAHISNKGTSILP